MLAHALNVRGGNQAAEYIAKYGRDERWGQSSEMTRHYAKQGAAGERDGLLHFTPFQLLIWAGSGDEWATRKFIEYARAIEGITGEFEGQAGVVQEVDYGAITVQLDGHDEPVLLDISELEVLG